MYALNYKMSQGNSFDGLDRTPVNTDATITTTQSNNAAYFVATNGSNQYRTNQTQLDFQITGTSLVTPPTFNFKNSLGNTNNTVIVAGQANFSEQTLTGTVGNSDILLDIQGYSSSINPLLRLNRNSSSDGTAASIVNTSSSNSTLALQNNATNAPVLTLLSPSLSSGNYSYLQLGKDLSANTNNFRLKYYYDTLEANRRFAIQAYDYGDTLSVYKPSVTATSTDGSLVVNGGLSVSSNIYSNSSISGTSLSAGSGTITTTGAISGGSLSAGSGTITTTGAISGASLATNNVAINSNGAITAVKQTLSDSTVERILYVNSTSTGSTASTTELFRVMHNNDSITGNIYALGEFFAQNMPTGTSAEIRVGKQYAGTSFPNYSTILGYTFNTTTALRKGYLRLSEKTNTVEFFQPSTVGTTANTGTVVVDGDIAGAGLRGTSLNLYETTSSANAVKLQATASTSAYTLKFPTNLGSTNDYLQLGASGQLQWSAGTGGGSGGSSAYVSAASYTSASTTLNADNTFYVITYPTTNYDVNTSVGYNPSPGTYPYFRNNSGGTVYIQVDGSFSFPASASGYSKTVELRTTTSSSINPISGVYVTVGNAQSSTTPIFQTTISAIIKLLSNECFIFVARLGTGTGSISLTSNIQFSVLGGSGLQSITLNSVSSFLTGSAQTTGLNPTVNFGLAQTPSGTGTTLVTNTSPSITTPTITSPTFSGTYSLFPTSVTTPDLLLTNNVWNINLKAPFLSSAYVLTLPATGGSAGQLLSSLGSGTLDWADVGTKIGTSTSSITSAMLTIDGTSTSSTIPNLLVRDYRSAQTALYPLIIQGPNMPNLANINIRLGKANSTNDSVELGMSFSGTGSSQNNFFVNLYNQTYSIKIYQSATYSTSSTTGTLVVNGGVGISQKSVFGTSSLDVTSSPCLEIRGISTSTLDNPPLKINNYSTTSAATISALTPSLQTGNEAIIRFGRDLSAFNSAALRFYYAGNGSTSNYASINLFNQGDSIRIYDDGITATNTTTGTLVVQGGVGCTSIASTSIASNTLNVANIDITPSQGTITDLGLRWGYPQGGSDATVYNLQYPSIPYEGAGSSGQIPNRRVYWQKIGKSYTFSLNLYVSIQNTSKQLHLLFIRSENNSSDYDFPTPACGTYTMSYSTSPNQYMSSVKFGLGVYIPAM